MRLLTRSVRTTFSLHAPGDVMKSLAKAADEKGSNLRARRRQKIVQAATKLFATLGYSACDMERVAARLKIAKGTIYLYFPSKEKLFLACVDAGMTQMRQTI